MIEPVYLHDWAKSKFEGMCKDFDGDRWHSYRDSPTPSHEKPEFQGIDVLFASYEYAGYEGDAFVLFRKDGKLYEVNGGHCSCYGLEGQWEPEETTIEALEHRVKEGNLGSSTYGPNHFAFELTLQLQKLKAREE
jgi:hypothetical protein